MQTKRMWLNSIADPISVITILVLTMGGFITLLILYAVIGNIIFIPFASVCGMIFVVMFTVGTLFAQTYAILDDEKITVKTLMGVTRTQQRWNNITNIQKQRAYYFHKYVCIYFNGEAYKDMPTAISMGVFKNIIMVLPTRKNLTILREYIKNYTDYGDTLIKPSILG